MAVDCIHIETPLGPPGTGTQVYKDECVYCCETAHSSGGIHVCLRCFGGFCQEHIGLHNAKTDHHLFLTRRLTAKPRNSEAESKVTKVAIGVPGGAVSDADRFEETCTAHCMLCPGATIEDGTVALVASQVMAHDSATRADDVKAWMVEKQPCEHVVMIQPAPVDGIHAGEQRCAYRNCGVTTNLWMCLSCGYMGCGRQNFDGSGGNGHAALHEAHSKHPLVVKFGTISSEGPADVYCYTCNDDRLNPMLGEHLAVFGIDPTRMRKTEKSIAELELDQNLALSLSSTFEGGEKLIPVSGPRLTGIRNLGNTCYMSTAMQCLAAVPFFARNFAQRHLDHISLCDREPTGCSRCQTGRIFHGLLSGDFSFLPAEDVDYNKGTRNDDIDGNKDGLGVREEIGVSPALFRAVTVGSHPDYSTLQQQDAHDYLGFILSTLRQKERSFADPIDPFVPFAFRARQTLRCLGCGRRRAQSIPEQTEVELPLPADVPKGTKVPIVDCFREFTAEEVVEITCPECSNAHALKSTALETFPQTLLVQLRRFTVTGGAVAKVSTEVDVHPLLDLSMLAAPADDGTIVWETPANSNGGVAPSVEAVAQMADMGFSRGQAELALSKTANNAERAIEWLFSHADEASLEHTASAGGGDRLDVPATEQAPLYMLRAIVTHRGNSWQCGHYVAHVLRTEGEMAEACQRVNGAVSKCAAERHWVLYNDRKVAIADTPPVAHAYLLFLERAGGKS